MTASSMIIRFRLLIILLGLTYTAFSQDFKIKVIHEVNPKFKDQRYEFPILIGQPVSIVDKVNYDLISDFLENAYQHEKESIFENVWATDENPIPRLSDLSFTKNCLNNKIYSITLKGEGCGAYCENFKTSYNYDLQTGLRIVFETLVSMQYKKNLLDTLTKWKRIALEEAINRAERKIKTEKLDSIDTEYYKEMISLYRDCLESANYDSFDYIDFSIQPKELVLVSGRCSAHYNRNVDEVDEFIYKLDLEKWKWILSEYGMKIINN